MYYIDWLVNQTFNSTYLKKFVKANYVKYAPCLKLNCIMGKITSFYPSYNIQNYMNFNLNHNFDNLIAAGSSFAINSRTFPRLY
ncbi:hypothetical protein BpHYR1_013418 [Brachionus plicatilis]|uniref:Uncharacterized protein n=1 Tax=Brachionus plicatilis TaxID=10195 RepID=A0A3M7QKJ0_BRAPC|nr:hypothetical protein BpHYR1_013418 [Brachionus plicatilis]